MRSVLIALLLSISAQASENSGYYEDKERGWFWGEEYPEEQVEEERKPVPQIPTSASVHPKQQETIKLDVKWLRENLPQIRESAINNPTTENIAAHMYAQRLMNDLGSRFATRSMEFMAFETELDEENRRPVTTFSLNVFRKEVQESIKQTISKINSNAHIWFFYSSTCQYCMKQIPVLAEMKYKYGLDVLAISMDGGVLPGMQDFEIRIDYGLRVSTQFEVTATPTIVMALENGKGFTTLAQGMMDMETLTQKMLLAARMNDVINDEEYQMTQEVKDINVLRDAEGTILADKTLLKEDSGYLAELLKQRLIDTRRFGSRASQGGR